MEDDVIGKVVEVEKEIADKIEIEKKMSQQWLEGKKREAEENISREDADFKESLNRSVQSARLAAESRAAAIIQDAEDEAARFNRLGDEAIKALLLKHLSRILPG